jgi:hypothetical protein
VIEGLAFLLGLVVGAAVGRWWALLLAVAPALWVWATFEVEVPSWFLAIGYGGIAALGVAAGVAIRRFAKRAPAG